MRRSLNNPWVDIVLKQMWLVRHATETMASCNRPEFLLDPFAMTDRSRDPREPRLNPLEFHGKRRVAAGRSDG